MNPRRLHRATSSSTNSVSAALVLSAWHDRLPKRGWQRPAVTPVMRGGKRFRRWAGRLQPSGICRQLDMVVAGGPAGSFAETRANRLQPDFPAGASARMLRLAAGGAPD
jgi:hypothetical protein